MTRILAIALALAVVAALAQSWRLAQAQTRYAELERDQSQQLAADNAQAVQAWRSEWDRQQAADAAQAAQDRATDSATAQAIAAIGKRYAGLVREIAPAGTCTLSPEWVRRYNEARK